MSITLRKKNSVTSIILFIYNIHNDYSDNYEIPLSDLIELIKKIGKSESSIRMSLSRLERSNILGKKIKYGEKYYYLTKEGIKNIDDWNLGISRYFQRLKLRNKKWDESWLIINLLDFKKSLLENKIIIDNLNELGLSELENNLWIGPYKIIDDVKSVLENKNVDYLIGYSGIEYSKNIHSFFKKNYELKRITKNYEELEKIIDEKLNKISDKKDYDLLPILFNLGWKFYDIATQDPLLPKELIPDWKGIKVQQKFTKLRMILIKRIFKYFDAL